MNDALWLKRGLTLVPSDIVTEELLAEIKNGVLLTTSAPRRRRNPQFHRLMMAMLQRVMEATRPRFTDIDDLMFYLKLRSHMFKEVSVYGGHVRLVPKSVSFASMAETEFRQVSDRWRYIISTDKLLLPGIDPETLLDEAMQRAA